MAYQTVEHRGTEEPRDIRGSVDIRGIGSKIEVSGGNSVTATFTAVAALDPQLYVDALIPGDGNFEEYLHEYIEYVANMSGLKSKNIELAFRDEYGGLTDRSWVKRLDVQFEPRFFDLEAGQEQEVQMRVTRHGGPSDQRAVLVVRLRDTENRELVTLSDFIVVGDDLSSFRVGPDAEGGSVSVVRQ